MREIPETVVKANIRNKVVIVAAVAEERDVKGYENFKHIGLVSTIALMANYALIKSSIIFGGQRHD